MTDANMHLSGLVVLGGHFEKQDSYFSTSYLDLEVILHVYFVIAG